MEKILIKLCSKCKNPIEESRKNQRYCKSCHAESMRKNRPKHSELSPLQKLKVVARAYSKEYVKRGLIIKKPCIVCGDKNSEIHHPDYAKPLEIIWYCRKHHLEHHAKEKIENG